MYLTPCSTYFLQYILHATTALFYTLLLQGSFRANLWCRLQIGGTEAAARRRHTASAKSEPTRQCGDQRDRDGRLKTSGYAAASRRNPPPQAAAEMPQKAPRRPGPNLIANAQPWQAVYYQPRHRLPAARVFYLKLSCQEQQPCHRRHVQEHYLDLTFF